jgi:uncharacterized protein YneF (UPF0154 family)
MNRALYIIGIVFAFVFFFVIGFFLVEADDAKWLDSYSDFGTSLYERVTYRAGITSLFFFLSFIVIDLMGLLKVKTSTMKVMAIIGLSLSGIFLIWNFAVLSNPGAISFDEVAMGYLFYSLIMLAFTIVGLIQSVKYYFRQKSVAVVSGNQATGDLLDS